MQIVRRITLFVVFLIYAWAAVQAQEPFYKGKTITIMRVEILQEAFRKTYRDPEFFKEYKKLTADDPTPLLPENHERTIREISRDREAIELFKKLVGADPLPPR